MDESRGTGLRPNRMPSEWEKRPLPMNQEAPQGPSKLRSNDPKAAAEAGGDYIARHLAQRPSQQGRAAAPMPAADPAFETTSEIASVNPPKGKGAI